MSGELHAPPGRAGRLWLQHRLATARQGADLLDHKLRILRTERERLALHRDTTATAWATASREADTWLLRSVVLGGGRSVRLSTESALTGIEIVWEQAMGVRYPVEAICTLPEPSADSPPLAGAALVTARELHRRALVAGVQQAVVEAAVRILEAEERATRRRLRAIKDRWIPRLEQALVETEFKLEEEEHADGVRLRWAAGRRQDPATHGLRPGETPAKARS